MRKNLAREELLDYDHYQIFKEASFRMNKSKLHVLKELSFAEQVSNHPTFQWAIKNTTNILSGVLLFIAVIFFLYRIGANDRTKAENDYYTAANAFNSVVTPPKNATPAERQENLEKLDKTLAIRPDLHSKYDAMVAQALLIQDHPQEAAPFAERTFNRVSKDNLPLYTEFAKITLMIEQKDYAQALSKSKQLKELLAKNSDTTAILSTYNLLRLALLEKTLNKKSEELQAWQELSNALLPTQTTLTFGDEQRLHFENLFTEGNLSLKSYIEQREKTLKDEL